MNWNSSSNNGGLGIDVDNAIPSNPLVHRLELSYTGGICHGVDAKDAEDWCQRLFPSQF